MGGSSAPDEKPAPLRVLLTYNDGNREAIELTRLIQHLGWEAHHYQLTGHQPVLQAPVYRAEAARRIEERVDQVKADVLLPIFEEVYFLSRLSWSCRTLMSPPEIYQTLHSKRLSADFNDRHRLPQVPTLQPDRRLTRAQLEEFAGGRSPLFLKHDNSRGGSGTRCFHSLDELWERLSEIDPTEYVIQPNQPGILWILQGVYREGRLLDYEIMQKVSLWQDQGSVRRNPFHRTVESAQTLQFLEQVGRHSGFSGMLEFECLGYEGELKILEYNPRFSGDFQHSVLSHSNFGMNTLRAYAGLEPLPHRADTAAMTRSSWSVSRQLGRQRASDPQPLLDPRWPLRMMLALTRCAWTRRRAPYTGYSGVPNSFRSFTELEP